LLLCDQPELYRAESTMAVLDRRQEPCVAASALPRIGRRLRPPTGVVAGLYGTGGLAPTCRLVAGTPEASSPAGWVYRVAADLADVGRFGGGAHVSSPSPEAAVARSKSARATSSPTL
jgi:hypothetical protein